MNIDYLTIATKHLSELPGARIVDPLPNSTVQLVSALAVTLTAL
jgi:hypothetical protein